MKNKDLIEASIGVAFAGASMKIVNDTDLPTPVKSLTNIMITGATIKHTGKKLKIL